MPSLQVRNLPEHLYQEIVQLAEAERRSINQETIVILEKALNIEKENKKHRQQLLKKIQEEIMKKIEYLYKMVDQFIDAKDIFEEALPLSCKISHSAYDAMYLVTSRRKNATLFTLDKRLVRAAKNIDVPVAVIT